MKSLPPQPPATDLPVMLPAAKELPANEPAANEPAPPRRPDPSPGTAPYWLPPGIESKILPRELRTEIVLMFAPVYEELVLKAKPGLAQSTGITIVHLLWLEILDQIEISRRRAAPDEELTPLNVLTRDSLAQVFERHLRVVHSKLNASDLLLRLKKFQQRARTAQKSAKPAPRELSPPRRRPRKPGKNDFR